MTDEKELTPTELDKFVELFNRARATEDQEVLSLIHQYTQVTNYRYDCYEIEWD